VNLCAHHLMDAEFPAKVRAVLERTGAPPEALRLEITESAVMPSPARALSVTRVLAGMGFRLALDNFGAGFSSLAWLKDLPVQELKVDRSLIAGLSSPGGVAVVRGAVDLAHALGREAVAEGVETIEDWETLKSLGCDAAQGYYASAPLPPDTLDDWLANFQRPSR